MEFQPNQVFNDRIFRPIAASDGEYWFLVVDVARGLGFKTSGEAMRYIDRSNLTTIDIRDVQYVDGTPARQQIAGQPNRWVTNLVGLFELALSGASPNSAEFREWITRSMLPRLYRHGYVTVEELNEAVEAARQEYAIS